MLDVTADGSGLRMTIGPVSVLLEQDPLSDEPSDSFLIPHEAFERYPLVFGRDDDRVVVEAFHGNTWFRGERYPGPEPNEPPEEWRRFTGLYRNDNPWSPTVRIVLRKGKLAIQWPAAASDEDGDLELMPTNDGWFIWSRRGGINGQSGSDRCKLYVSPVPAAVPDAFAMTVFASWADAGHTIAAANAKTTRLFLIIFLSCRSG